MTSIKPPQLPDDERQVVRGVDKDGKFAFGQVGVEEINYKGRFGALARSSTENTIAIGDHYFVLDLDEDKFRIGDDVLVTSLDDQDCFMWGEIVNKDTVGEPLRIQVYVDDISGLVGTYSNWEVQVVARPKPGIEKDISTSNISFADTMTFAVTANKFFPIGGKLLIKALASPTKLTIGKVLAYSGTSLVVSKVAGTTGATGGPFSSWSIALLDAPQDKIQKYAINGLAVTQNASDWKDIDISAGSVRDSTDTMDLVLPTKLTKRLDAAFAVGTNQGAYTQSPLLTGTITASAGNVTGVGTAFLTEYGNGVTTPTNNDLADQYANWPLASAVGAGVAHLAVITTGALIDTLEPLTNTTANLYSLPTFATARTHRRGGWTPGSMTTGQFGFYAICLIRRDSDGWVDVCASSMTPSGVPDLPSGYTYYRTLAQVTTLETLLEISQPLRANISPASSEIEDRPGIGVTRTWLDNPVLGTNLDNVDGHIDILYSYINALQATVANVTSGTYTPTLTNGTNVAASTATNCQYLQVGNTVTVSGRIVVDPTAAAGTASTLGISLPIASNFTNVAQLSGVGSGIGVNECAFIDADTTNDRANMQWLAQTLANHGMTVHFTYRVI